MIDCTKLYPSFFDPSHYGQTPDQNSADTLLIAAKQHLLLFDQLVLQDNFLISEVMLLTAGDSGNPLAELADEGLIRIALRDSAYSLRDLLMQLTAKVEQDPPKYLPFEGHDRGLNLYRNSLMLRKFLSDVDSTLAQPSACAPWSQDELGMLYRSRMRRAAEERLAGGLPPERALRIWEDIDLEAEGTHSQSMYLQHAAKLESEETKSAIRAWSQYVYLRNLPSVLGVGISLSSHMAATSGMINPFEAAHQGDPIRDEATRLGRDCILFNRDFLLKLSTANLLRMRKLPEFRAWRESLQEGDPHKSRGALIDYFSAIGDLAPRIYARQLQNSEVILRCLSAGKFGSVFGGLWLQIGGLGATAEFFVKAYKARVVTPLLDKAKSRLSCEPLEVIEPALPEFCHSLIARRS